MAILGFETLSIDPSTFLLTAIPDIKVESSELDPKIWTILILSMSNRLATSGRLLMQALAMEFQLLRDPWVAWQLEKWVLLLKNRLCNLLLFIQITVISKLPIQCTNLKANSQLAASALHKRLNFQIWYPNLSPFRLSREAHVFEMSKFIFCICFTLGWRIFWLLLLLLLFVEETWPSLVVLALGSEIAATPGQGRESNNSSHRFIQFGACTTRLFSLESVIRSRSWEEFTSSCNSNCFVYHINKRRSLR